MLRLLVLVLLVGWCESGAGRVRAVRGWLPRPTRLLVVVAHPDDELSCSMLVLTRGEGGGDPDVRTREMALSAHASQFTAAQVESLRTLPEEQRFVAWRRSV